MRRRPLLGRAALALACAAGLVAGPVHAQHASDEDVPFITTPDRVTLAMLQLAGAGPADRLVDLGSGPVVAHRRLPSLRPPHPPRVTR